ncbi:MAG: thiamine phosphate synthase [Bacteroidota bacterium]
MTAGSGQRTADGERRALPRLVLIADGFTSEAVQRQVLEAVQAGRLWLHLRDHAASDEAFAQAAHALAAQVRAVRPGTLVSVNTRTEVARPLGVGLHVGTRGPSVAEARRRHPGALLSYAAHTPSEARAAAEQGADAVLFSPIFPTTSKPGHLGIGLEALAACCAAVPDTPVFALGGITPARAASCLSAGAYGVAVLSGILRAPDPAAATALYLDAL